MAAALDYHLVLWLRRERRRAARINDGVRALTQMHDDFKWPYPLLSSAVVDALSRRLQSSANLHMLDGAESLTGSSVSGRASPRKPPRPAALTVITNEAADRNPSTDSGSH